MRDLVDAIVNLQRAETAAELMHVGVEHTRAFGFGGIFVVSPISRDSRDGRGLTYAGFDDIWARAYRRWLHRTDPLVEITLDHPRPFRWSEAAALRDLTHSEQRYLAIMVQRGMQDGLSFPVYGPTARTAMVGLGRHPDLSAITGRQIHELRIFLQMSYLRYCEMISADFERENVLSKRELDVLFWISRGKTNASIATILDISTDTVDTYVRRIFKKFDVTDRAAAIMAGVQHGYLIAANYPREGGVSQSAEFLSRVSPVRVTLPS